MADQVANYTDLRAQSGAMAWSQSALDRAVARGVLDPSCRKTRCFVDGRAVQHSGLICRCRLALLLESQAKEAEIVEETRLCRWPDG